MTWNTCCKCKTKMWIPDELNTAALAARGTIPFYCAYGHQQFYINGESEETKLRRERDQLNQRLAQKDDEIVRQRGWREETERKLYATRGVVTRIKNRIGHGVCPCCNRTFGDLSRHMATKHPTYAAEAAE
jgi:hypothetical protein